MKDKSKVLETCLVISTGILIIFLLLEVKHFILIYVAAGIGVSGILIRPLARVITRGWFGLAELLSKVSSTIIMTVVYYLILAPIAFFYKLSNRHMLDLKNRKSSMWHQRDHEYSGEDLKNAW